MAAGGPSAALKCVLLPAILLPAVLLPAIFSLSGHNRPWHMLTPHGKALGASLLVLLVVGEEEFTFFLFLGEEY